jgi:serine/threonine protein kinase
MSFAPRTRIGAFEITDTLGAGGMGEVYRARDTKLDREVAIKVLPDAFARDPERVARFAREAKTLASLNHPNIGGIYGLEEAPGLTALVLELVEGETLADRIARGGIAIDEALPIARQIADALEAAHEQGIIHRDLKPANIKVRDDGTVKVLDFGLAKALHQAQALSPKSQANDRLANSPTITSPALMTGIGVLLGTAAYMSPEQAKGREADKRSDIWAFGCVLFEMLTGTRTFPGDDLSETLAAVIKSDPNWRALPSDTPASIRRLLRRCLQKDRKDRVADAASLRLEIADAREHSSDDSPSSQHTSSRRLHATWAAAAALLTLAASAITWTTRPQPRAPERRFTINVPPAREPLALAISPNGEHIVFEATVKGIGQLWLRTLNSTMPRPLNRTEGAASPFWSPDSRSIGFVADRKLKRIDLDDGTVQPLEDLFGANAGSAWGDEGITLYEPFRREFRRISASGGKPSETLAKSGLGLEGLNARLPRLLSDGSHFLFIGAHTDGNGVYVAALDGSAPRHLIDADDVAYASGHLFFVRKGTLFAQPFEAARATLSGEPAPVADNVGVVVAAGSPAGGITLAYRSEIGGVNLRQFAWVDRTGTVLQKVGEPYQGGTVGPALSPDGQAIAVGLVESASSNSDLWLVETARGVASRVTADPFRNNGPVFSPDGKRIVYQSDPKRIFDLYVKNLAGDSAAELLLSTPYSKMPSDWHRRHLLFSSQSVDTGSGVWAMPMDSAASPFVVADTSFDERNAQFSPDGKWIAFQSNESGETEIYVQRFQGPGGKQRISTRGGAQVRWKPDGSELYYIALDNRLMAVSIRVDAAGERLEPGVPVPLFTTEVGGATPTQQSRQQYFVSRDGQRFLMSLLTQEAIESPITVILNWTPKR